jgi:hypothetical protein
MRATMRVDVDAGTRAERIRRGRAVRSSRSLAARKQAPLRPGACAGGAVEVVERACNRRVVRGSKNGAQAPGRLPDRSRFSLFINTLKFNRSGTILAFG